MHMQCADTHALCNFRYKSKKRKSRVIGFLQMSDPVPALKRYLFGRYSSQTSASPVEITSLLIDEQDSFLERASQKAIEIPQNYALLFHMFSQAAGPPPSGAVLAQAITQVDVALDYGLSGTAGFSKYYAEDEGHKVSMLWRYIWDCNNRSPKSRSLKMQKLKFLLQKLQDEEQVDAASVLDALAEGPAIVVDSDEEIDAIRSRQDYAKPKALEEGEEEEEEEEEGEDDEEDMSQVSYPEDDLDQDADISTATLDALLAEEGAPDQIAHRAIFKKPTGSAHAIFKRPTGSASIKKKAKSGSTEHKPQFRFMGRRITKKTRVCVPADAMVRAIKKTERKVTFMQIILKIPGRNRVALGQVSPIKFRKSLEEVRDIAQTIVASLEAELEKGMTVPQVKNFVQASLLVGEVRHGVI